MTIPLQPSGFFVLRTPLLEFDEFLQWAAEPNPAERMLEMLDRPEIAEAIRLASPSLTHALANPESARGKKAMSGLAAYFARMCSRVAPFGLFAGHSVGHLGPKTALEVPDRGNYRRHTRLDLAYLCLLVAALETDPAVRRLLTWTPNTSLYPAGGRLHMAAARLVGSRREYDLVAVDNTEALGAALDRARSGATVAEIIATLVGVGGGIGEAESFVTQLIDAQLLVSDLELGLTGAEPIDALVSTLLAHPYTAGFARRLDGVRTALQALDGKGLRVVPDDYSTVRTMLAGLPGNSEDDLSFQVDLVKAGRPPTLGPGPLTEIAHAIDLLNRLAPAPRSDDALVRFRDAFVERYGQVEVSALEALDPEVGIGFGDAPVHDRSPLLSGLELSPGRPESAAFGRREAHLLRKLAEALEIGSREISLERGDLDILASPEPTPLPDAVEVVAVLAARSALAADRGDFRLLIRGILGPPGVTLLGRLCHADEELRRCVKAHVRAEEACRPDAVFAEVVHLPQGRLGNILCRPVLRSFEIPYLGRSGAPVTAQVPVSDLLVSVVGSTVILRSARLGREVIPRLTTAHNFTSDALSIYHFLCALQDQGTASRFGWDWGALGAAPFLPRVTCGRLVLARAQWNLDGPELASLPDLRASGRLPRFVALVDGDNDLVTDLDNPLSVQALRRHVSGSSANVVELFPAPEDLCAHGPGGRFAHDLVVPFVRAAPPAAAHAPVPRRPTVRRSFSPGSEWFYAKLYAGAGTADRVIVDLIGPLVAEALRLGAADSWFFVRYGDPEWHLRVRMHGDTAAILPLLDAFAEPFLEDGRIWRVQVDTYVREIERYGGDDGVAMSEQWFHHDSNAVLAILRRYGGDAGHDSRWRLALLGIDMLLDDLGLDLAGKESWARKRREAYAEEFQAGGRLRGQLGDIHRRERQALNALLEGSYDQNEVLAHGVAVLRRRSEWIRPLVQAMHERGLDVADLASSYAHMHVNRMLRTSHRPQELVIYDLLHRLYVSGIARSRRN